MRSQSKGIGSCDGGCDGGGTPLSSLNYFRKSTNSTTPSALPSLFQASRVSNSRISKAFPPSHWLASPFDPLPSTWRYSPHSRSINHIVTSFTLRFPRGKGVLATTVRPAGNLPPQRPQTPLFSRWFRSRHRPSIRQRGPPTATPQPAPASLFLIG